MPKARTLDGVVVNLTRVAKLVVDEHAAAPCAVVGAACRRDRGWRFGWGAYGRRWVVPPPGATGKAPTAGVHDVFDLASVSKPVTALTLARLERAGVVARDEPLGEVLPELRDSASGDATLDRLLSHRAGLEAHIEFFVKSAGAEQPRVEAILRRAAEARRADCRGAAGSDGFPLVYSDLGYILAGAALERRGGLSLDALVEREVSRPLGLSLGSARRLEETATVVAPRFVPTEDVGWRGGVIAGVAHDENAWVLAGRGSAGHAGLFADVWSLVTLGTAVLDALHGRSDWLAAAELEPLVAARAGGSHAAGFDRRAREAPSSGALFGAETFGHLGFTGTSLWIDPELELVGILLSNRVHPSRENTAIRAARPAAYDAIHRAMIES